MDSMRQYLNLIKNEFKLEKDIGSKESRVSNTRCFVPDEEKFQEHQQKWIMVWDNHW